MMEEIDNRKIDREKLRQLIINQLKLLNGELDKAPRVPADRDDLIDMITIYFRGV